MTAQAYIYRRFSADEQEKGAGDTLNRQKERCEAYAAENGWQVTEVMTDKGRSAFKGEHLYPEAELGQFVERVTRGEISSGSVLIAERLDRLSRRPVNEAMAWIHAMTSAGIKIAIADSRNVFGVNQDMGSFLATAIQAATGHEESRKKSEQTTLSKQKLWKLAEVREGKWANLANKIPSWLKRKPGCDGFEVIEERADVVRLIYQMSADGVGVNTITRQLNEGINGKVIPPFAKAIKHKGVPHKWGRSGVRQLLKSPTVEGDFRPATGAHKGRVIHGFYPRIVDADIVSLARADLTARRKVAGKSAASGSSNIFAGITSCGHCGRRAFLTTSTQKGKPYPYLRCEAAGERRCENVGGYSYRAFENTVLDLMLDMALDDRFFAVTGELRAGRIRKAEIEKALADKRAFRARLLMNFGQGDDQAAEMIAVTKTEIDTLSARLVEIESAILRASGAVGNIEHLRRVGDIREASNSADEAVRVQARSKLRLAMSSIIMSVDIERDETGERVFTVILKGGIMAVRIDMKGRVKKSISDATGKPLWSYLPDDQKLMLAPLIDRIEKMAV